MINQRESKYLRMDGFLVAQTTVKIYENKIEK